MPNGTGRAAVCAQGVRHPGRPRRRRHFLASSAAAFVEGALHRRTGHEQPWKHLPLVLALAFAARAAVALSGDFVLHPDEIMQYLEPAHRLAFGNGVIYWEYFYGARSWLVPGVVAGVLKLFDLVGLGQPWWYVGAVKLLFCALSLAVPAAMYWAGRRHFGEAAARMALLAGSFWYELVAFAHKPMTEFVATAPLLALLALCLRPHADGSRVVWQAAGLAVIAAAIRLQYAPLALLLLGIVLWRTRDRLHLVLASVVLLFAIGVLDGLTWGRGLFHSYVTNLQFNMVIAEWRVGESPPYQYLWWLTLGGGGLCVLSLALALVAPRRYGLLLALIAIALLAHSLQAHKEYRFIFVVIPLWLLLGADLATRAAASASARVPRTPGRWAASVAGAACLGVSLAGLLNALPYQEQVYRAWSQETGKVSFVRRRMQDPVFAAYRYLAREPGVDAVWQVDRAYHGLPGYYYLHRRIPFYDAFTGRGVSQDLATLSSSVSHVLSVDPAVAVAGYSLEREFGGVRILRRDAGAPRVRQWQDYTPTPVHESEIRVMGRVDANAPTPPANAGIRFAAR